MKQLEEVFTAKDAIADACKDKLTDKMGDFGWQINSVLVLNVAPDKMVESAMNGLETAKKEKVCQNLVAAHV